MAPENLWPENLGTIKVRTPGSILKEQANFLGEATKQLLKGEVRTSGKANEFIHIFYIVAPTFNNYRLELFTMYHDLIFYPLKISSSDNFYEVPNEDALIETLREIFTRPRTQATIASLLAQVTE